MPCLSLRAYCSFAHASKRREQWSGGEKQATPDQDEHSSSGNGRTSPYTASRQSVTLFSVPLRPGLSALFLAPRRSKEEQRREIPAGVSSAQEFSGARPLVNLEKTKQKKSLFHRPTWQGLPKTNKHAPAPQAHIPREPAQNESRVTAPTGQHSSKAQLFAEAHRTEAVPLQHKLCSTMRTVAWRGAARPSRRSLFLLAPAIGRLAGRSDQTRPVSSCGAVWFCAISEIGHEALAAFRFDSIVIIIVIIDLTQDARGEHVARNPRQRAHHCCVLALPQPRTRPNRGIRR